MPVDLAFTRGAGIFANMTSMRLQVVDVSDETLSEAVARRLRGLLAEQRITASALAREMGMKQSSISRRLVGDTPLTLDELSQIAEILGITEVELLTGQRTVPRPDGPSEGLREPVRRPSRGRQVTRG